MDLIERARTHIIDKNVMIVSPPGSGKSVVISEIIKRATDKGGRVLFLVHRKELIEQITNSLVVHGVNLKCVDLLTIGKARNRLSVLQKPTLIITDEGHHGKASTYQAIYDYYSDVPRVGFTATPWRMSGAGFTDTYDVMVEGKTVQWLIDHHRLADCRYFSLLAIDTSKLKTRNGEYTNRSIDEAFGKAIYGNVVREYRKRSDGQQAILYAHSIEASRSFSKEFNEAGIESVHVDSKTPKIEREKLMQAFRDGEIKVLCNVDLISEGFDVPDCSVTILCRPTKSLVLYLQQSMRSMRYQPGKIATIIDCVVNWKIHGLPYTPHDWETYFKGGWKKRKKSENTIQAKECPECSAMWPLNQSVCDLCGYDFGEREQAEKERIEAELVEIKRQEFQLMRTAGRKYGSDLSQNWQIAKARAKLNGGKPLYKLLFYYVGNTKLRVSDDDIIRMTGVSIREYQNARRWVKKQKNKIITRY
ncbi:helicase [Streptococcus acidominimus]|uniref:Helicase n=2 Tax=Streptococcus acidominimus TaxID=1326 RepID=A0A1Q8EFR9_STRAI|nr:helicase [Streptococcus acidominimus]